MSDCIYVLPDWKKQAKPKKKKKNDPLSTYVSAFLRKINNGEDFKMEWKCMVNIQQKDLN